MMPALEAADTQRPRVLVLMASYNGASWVEAQLRSIFAQQILLSLAVRDDASTDDTLTVIQAACDRQPNVVIHRASAPSGSAAKNFFMLMQSVDVTGQDFVALADQDDVWEPDKLARAVACLRKSGATGYSAAVRAFWPNGKTAVLSQNPRPTAADYLFEGAGQGCTFVMRTAFFARVQRTLTSHRSLLARIHYHDWALYALCRIESGRWFYDHRVCMQYRQHEANDTGARSGLAAMKKRIALVRSGWYGEQIDAIARLCVAADTASGAPASLYLRYCYAAKAGLMGRLALCRFVLRAGRRRLSDRLLLAWAALSGHLTRDAV